MRRSRILRGSRAIWRSGCRFLIFHVNAEDPEAVVRICGAGGGVSPYVCVGCCGGFDWALGGEAGTLEVDDPDDHFAASLCCDQDAFLRCLRFMRRSWASIPVRK